MPAEPRRFIHLFGGPRESSDLVGIARACCREGYAVLPIEPGGKKALCTLTPRQKVAADRMAANAARESGRKHWEAARHDCGLSHAITDPKDADRIFRRMVGQQPDLNLALECSQSRLICVDCDNTDELRSFTALWAERDGVPELVNAAPTVRTPGKVDEDGQWVHKDGGHYWFLLPDDVDFIDTPISTSLPIGLHEVKAQIRYGRSYALVPPSVRDEGPYVMASDIGMCPPWLVDILSGHVNGVRERRALHLTVKDGSDPIDVWSSITSWEELLGGDGWTTRGRPDNCGCPIWTRPGEWTNPKSATAHEPGCVRWNTDDAGHGFLHVWTDNAPDFIAEYRAATGHSSMSKLQYVSWRDFQGSSSEAMRALGILSNAEEKPSYDDLTALIRKNREEQEEQGKDQAPDVESQADGADQEPEEDPKERTTWWFRDLSTVLSGENPEPEPSVLARSDGRCLFYPGKVNGLLGESESGKTWVALQAVAEELRAGHPVLYLDFEDTAPGIVSRLRNLNVSDELMDPEAELLAYIGPEESLHGLSKADLAEAVASRQWSLIVLDGYNAALSTMALKLMDNSDITTFFTALLRPLSATGAAVVTIDHVPKDPENRNKGGIGAQAKRATVTGSSVRVVVVEPFGRGKPGQLSLEVDKDRPGHVRGATNLAGAWAVVDIKADENGDVEMCVSEAEQITKVTGITNTRAEEFREKVSKFLESNDAEISGSLVEKSVTGNSSMIREALAWLSESGYINRRLDPKTKRTQLHSFQRSYTRPQSNNDDLFKDRDED